MNKLRIILYVATVIVLRTFTLSLVTTYSLIMAPNGVLAVLISLLEQVFFAGLTVLLFKEKSVHIVTLIALATLVLNNLVPFRLLIGTLSNWENVIESGRQLQMILFLGQTFFWAFCIIPIAWALRQLQKRKATQPQGAYF